MKKNKMLPLIIVAVVIGVAALGAIAFLVLKVINASPKETYRSVDVEDYDGKVIVKRKESGDKMDPYEGMKLIPKDLVATAKDSSITLLVDSDKHIEAGEKTKFTINAVGDEESGKVTIDLEEGKALFTIDNKLNEDSSFKVKTPNATMSVRGTTFEVIYDDGKAATVLNVKKGKVAVSTELYDEEILVGKDEAIIVHKGMTGEIISPDSIKEYLDALPDADEDEKENKPAEIVEAEPVIGEEVPAGGGEAGFNRQLATDLFEAPDYQTAYRTILSNVNSYIDKPVSFAMDDNYRAITYGVANVLGDDTPELLVQCQYVYNDVSVFYSYDTYVFSYYDRTVSRVCVEYDNMFVNTDGELVSQAFSRGTGDAWVYRHVFDEQNNTFNLEQIWEGTLGGYNDYYAYNFEYPLDDLSQI